MIATSGALMMGVEAMPPSLPRLVTVMVEPGELIAGRFVAARALGETPDLGGGLPEPPRLGIAHHRYFQTVRSLRGDAECTARWRTNTPRAASYSTLHCGNESSTRVSAMTTSGRKVKLALSAGRDRFNCCRSDSSSVTSDLFDVREVRDIALRLAHAFGDQRRRPITLISDVSGGPCVAPIPRDGPPPDPHAECARRGRTHDRGQVDSRFSRPPPIRRRCHDAAGRSAGAAAASGVFAMGGAGALTGAVEMRGAVALAGAAAIAKVGGARTAATSPTSNTISGEPTAPVARAPVIDTTRPLTGGRYFHRALSSSLRR